MRRLARRRGSTPWRRWLVTDARPILRNGGAELSLLGTLFIAATLSACAVGPDYAPAPAPDVTRFTKEATASPGNGQSFRSDADVSPQWWKAYGSETRDDRVSSDAGDRREQPKAARKRWQTRRRRRAPSYRNPSRAIIFNKPTRETPRRRAAAL